MAANTAPTGRSPSARFRLLYCKMRFAGEANFLQLSSRADSGARPAPVFCVEISGKFRRHGSLRTDCHELAETPRLCHGRAWHNHARRSAHAWLSGLFSFDLRAERPHRGSRAPVGGSVEYSALGAGLIVGIGTLFRPETPLLLIAAAIAFAVLFFRLRAFARWLWITLAMTIGCLVVLSPWTLRNLVTFHEVQFLTPKYSTLPGEIVPNGFMAWERTWLYRVRDCYLVPWKLNEEAINVDEIPARAFDSPEEKQRVADILEQYNEDLTLTKEEDDAFGQIARERTPRHALRIFLGIPAVRAVVIWFTPRIELLPISGNVFPLAQMHDEDPEAQGFTVLLFFLNIIYVGLGAWGAVRLWRSSTALRAVVAFLVLFMLLRTAFLTTLETPEPRYVLVCFPMLIAMAAQLLAGKRDRRSST